MRSDAAFSPSGTSAWLRVSVGSRYDNGRRGLRCEPSSSWMAVVANPGRHSRHSSQVHCPARPAWPALVPLNSPSPRTKLAQVSLSIGIVGLPNVGKSTLFNALTRAGALASSYAFATIEPNVGVVGVPDPRLAELAKLYDSARIAPASVRFTDLAGLVRGASEGHGLGNQFLPPIRQTTAISQLFRLLP